MSSQKISFTDQRNLLAKFKATPHKACAEDALSDCIEIPQAYWSVGQAGFVRCYLNFRSNMM